MGYFQPLVIYRNPNDTRENSIVKYIGNRVLRGNKNLLFFLTGATGCIFRDTILYGQTKTVDQLYKSGEININTVSIFNGKGFKSRSKIIFSGRKLVYEIKFKDKRSIIATLDHTLFKLDTTRVKHRYFIPTQVRHLKKGDYLEGFGYCIIKSIKKIGYRNTYDIHTPKFHNFLLSNCILSSNSGKSYAGLAIGEIYSKMFNIPFDPSVHVISSLKELLKLITADDVDKKIQFGSYILFDEPQVEANAHNWQSEMNQAFSQLISTFRNQRLVVGLATPYIEMVDKQSRLLFHLEIKIQNFDKNTKITNAKPRFLEYNKKTGDFYRKRLIVNYKTKEKESMNITKINNWHIPLASKETIDIYEAKKKKFTDDLNKRLLNSIELAEKQAEGKNKSDELFKVKELYDTFGEDYVKILQEMPYLSPFTVEKYLQFIKKSKKKLKNDTIS